MEQNTIEGATDAVEGLPDGAEPVVLDVKAIALKDVSNRFTYHPPKADQPDRYVRMRDRYRELAEHIVLNTPASREQSTALTLLDQSMMMANASISRNE